MNNDERNELDQALKAMQRDMETTRIVDVEMTIPKPEGMRVVRLASGNIQLRFVNGYCYELKPVHAHRLKGILEMWT